MSEGSKLRPPWTVTLVVVLIYIAGILDVLSGVLLLFLPSSSEGAQGGLELPVILTGAATILVGVAIIAVAFALFRGSATARGLVTVFLTLSLALDVVSYVFDTAAGPAVLIQQLVFTVFIVLLLWSGPGRRYFDARGAAAARLA